METAPLRIIFAGTPEFAAVALAALLKSHHQVIAVYTQPDRPAGRGRQLTASPVKALALQHDIPVYQPVTLRDETEQKKLADLQADAMIVAAYGLILPPPVLTAPRLGCINIHASLLPRWRGAAPIHRAILAGDTTTGITIMQMDEGLDTGSILDTAELPILENFTSQKLHDLLAEVGAHLLLKTLDNLQNISPVQQDNALATYANKISKEEAMIDWTLSAIEIDRKIRAFNSWPVAETLCGKEKIRIWQATVLSTEGVQQTPGKIVETSSHGLDIATGQGVLRLLKIQFPGGRVLAVNDVLNARSEALSVGQLLGSPC